MTINKFMIMNKIKRKDTVKKWISQGYLPGTTYNEETKEYDIPDGSFVPYTKRRAKTAKAIYKSIITASNKRKYVCAELYGISEEEFRVYIKNLEDEKIIDSIEFQGSFHYITKYDPNGKKVSEAINRIMSNAVVIATAVAALI